MDHGRIEGLLRSFGGKYRYIGLLGSGGMGEVLLVEHRGLKQYCAMKAVFKEERSAGRQRALANEAERMKTLRDPRIPYLIDYLESDEGAALVMEYVEGETLQEYLKAHAPLPEAEALRIIKCVCGIIAYLHAQRPQILYLDIKPGNFIRRNNGEICLLDFGTCLSGWQLPSRIKVKETEEGFFAGTPGYAAPEQLAGKGTGPAADVYALGALYTYLLTGQDPARPPYRPADIVLFGGTVADGTGALIRRCLEQDPGARYPDAGVLDEALSMLTPERGSLFSHVSDLLYRGTLILNIMIWLLLIFGREKGFYDQSFEQAALLLLAATAVWTCCRDRAGREKHLVIERDWNLLYTEKQAPGL